MEEANEAYERVLADTAKFERAEAEEATGRDERARARARDAIEASEVVLYHLAKAAFERAGKDERAKFAGAAKAIIGLEAFDRAARAKYEETVKENIKKFKAERAKFKKYVIVGIERAEAKRAKTYVLASSNTVTITSGKIGQNVYGGYIHQNGTATLNKVNLTSVTATKDVYGAWIGKDGLASSNTVKINGGIIGVGMSGENVIGGYIVGTGTATLNTVNLTDVVVGLDVCGVVIGNGGLASSNEVTITGGRVGRDVFGGYIHQNGTAIGNTVTISGGKVKGNVFGGYVGGNGEATYNTINITAAELSSPEFSPESILCGGICANATTNDAVTGNTLNIETKGVEVKGISNFEKYKFHLKDIKAGETILTATSGGCSWNTVEHNYTSDCAVDISRSNMNISLHTQGVLNKKDRFTLIKSPKGFKDNVVAETKQCEFENEGLLIKYYWDIKIADNKEDLEAILVDKKIRDEGFARSLSEGYGAGVVCVNNGMDCIFSKMEETEELSSKEQSPKSRYLAKEQSSKEKER